jgi:4-diphosphocytidyl-2-C-methyl-D-erythritol kinase
MKKLTLKALGKINLGLDVTGVRPDGYHEVRMIMQTVNLYDTIVLESRDTMDVTMECNLKFLPINEENLCIRAAKLMMEKYDIKHGFHISLTKRIPVAAGMAGGSTDAAAVIYGINRMEGLGISKKELMEESVVLGADIPYCIMRGTALAEGIGEELTRLPALPKVPVLIARPPFPVSTKEVYTALDAKDDIVHPDIDALIEDIKTRDIDSLCEHMGNVLEDVTIPLHPEIQTLKEMMLEDGAIGAMMSGSGPTVFGIFRDKETMMRCKNRMRDSGLTQIVYGTTMFS